MERSRDFIAYYVVKDESMDVKDTAHLAIFIRGVYSKLCVTEEILVLKCIKVLRMEHVVTTVMQIVNFIRTKG